jgi:L-histidine N-alpha-methyltransferase
VNGGPESERYRVVETRAAAGRSAFAQAVREGLAGSSKALPCQFIYDADGSALFEEICGLEEYYPPEAEREVIERHADAIVAGCESPCELVELGSGSAEKTHPLLSALQRRQGELRYVPIDVSRSALEQSADRMFRCYDRLTIHALVGDYETALARMAPGEHARLFLWLGSSIGNLNRTDAAAFLSRLPLGPRDRAFIGIDLRKERATLERAYDDPAGVTRRFIFNVLHRINRELGGDFEPEHFDYEARYDADAGRVEMGVRSRRAQQVRIDALEMHVTLRAGERIHVESSYKYSPEEIDRLVRQAGLRVQQRWTDSGSRFANVLLAPA